MFDSMVRDNNDAGKREGGTATIRIKRLLALASELDRENLEGYLMRSFLIGNAEFMKRAKLYHTTLKTIKCPWNRR